MGTFGGVVVFAIVCKLEKADNDWGKNSFAVNQLSHVSLRRDLTQTSTYSYNYKDMLMPWFCILAVWTSNLANEPWKRKRCFVFWSPHLWRVTWNWEIWVCLCTHIWVEQIGTLKKSWNIKIRLSLEEFISFNALTFRTSNILHTKQ